jgi:ribosomal protein S20
MNPMKFLDEARRSLAESPDSFMVKVDVPGLGKGITLRIGATAVVYDAEEPEPFIVNGVRIRGRGEFSVTDDLNLRDSKAFGAAGGYFYRTDATDYRKRDISDSARRKILSTMRSFIQNYIRAHPGHIQHGKAAETQADLDRVMSMIQTKEAELTKLHAEADRLRKELARVRP